MLAAPSSHTPDTTKQVNRHLSRECMVCKQLASHSCTSHLSGLQIGSFDSPLFSHTPFTRYNQLSNRLYNGFDNRVERTANVRSTGCQTGLYNRFDNRLNTRYSRLSNRLSNGFDNWLNVCIHDTTGCQTGLTTGCIVYTNI